MATGRFRSLAGLPASSDALRQQLALQLIGRQQAPSNVGEGLFSAGQSIASALTANRLADTAGAQQKALTEALIGSGQQVPSGAPQPAAGTPTVARPGGVQTGTAGIVPPDQRGLAAALMGTPQGAQSLTQRAVEQVAPEQLSPAQEAQIGLEERRLEQQQGQFEQAQTLKREQFESDQQFKAAELALEEAALTTDAAPDLSDTAGLRKEFTKQSDDFIRVRDAFAKLQASTEQPSAAGDVALVFNFMKMVDPQSVVREGEFATAESAAGVPERIRNFYNRVLSGERLTDRQRQDFLAQAGGIMNAQLQQQKQSETQFGRLAQRQRMDPENVVVDFIGKFRDFQPPQPPDPSEFQQQGESFLEGIERGARSLFGRETEEQQPRQQAARPQSEQAGMQGTPINPQASEEGLTATNPQTGERVIFRNGRWEPL